MVVSGGTFGTASAPLCRRRKMIMGLTLSSDSGGESRCCNAFFRIGRRFSHDIFEKTIWNKPIIILKFIFETIMHYNQQLQIISTSLWSHLEVS